MLVIRDGVRCAMVCLTLCDRTEGSWTHPEARTQVTLWVSFFAWAAEDLMQHIGCTWSAPLQSSTTCPRGSYSKVSDQSRQAIAELAKEENAPDIRECNLQLSVAQARA